MEKKEKERLINKLFSSKEIEVLESIKLIRKVGDVSFLNAILELLNTAKSEKVSSSIANMLNELKDTKAIPIIADAIVNQNSKRSLKALVSSCWQSGLDYRNYINIFVDVFINENFITAFEAFTVIENSEAPKNSEEILPIIDKLKKSASSIHPDKKDLLADLIIILQNFHSNIKTL